MFNSLLLSEAAQTAIMWAIIGVFVVIIIVFYVMSSRKRKKQEQEAKDLIDAVKPGNKVKTIGGICGIVVEVDAEENTFVLETGTELSGKSYIKFDRQAIYQTDAQVEKAAPAQDTESTKTEEPSASSGEVISETAVESSEEKKASDEDNSWEDKFKDKK